MIVPPGLAKPFVAARSLIDLYSPTIQQAVVADFIAEGHLARHIRKTRLLNVERQEALVRALRSELVGLLDISPAPAGLHLIGQLAEGVDDREVSREAAARGVDAQPLSTYYLDQPRRGGLLLGYAAYNEKEIWAGAHALAAACRAVSQSLIRRAS
jgi:GntR family transcriptional regulator/MocR family aminotransferase